MGGPRSRERHTLGGPNPDSLFEFSAGLEQICCLKRGRANLKKFVFLALTARTPMLTTATLDLLSSLCAHKNGLKVVRSVVDRVDTVTSWGETALGRFGVPEAPEDFGASGRPPQYAAFCTLLKVPENDFDVATSASIFLRSLALSKDDRTEILKQRRRATRVRASLSQLF